MLHRLASGFLSLADNQKSISSARAPISKRSLQTAEVAGSNSAEPIVLLSIKERNQTKTISPIARPYVTPRYFSVRAVVAQTAGVMSVARGSPTFWPHAVEGLSFCPRISSDHHTRRIPSRTVSIIAANVPLSCVFVNPR